MTHLRQPIMRRTRSACVGEPGVSTPRKTSPLPPLACTRVFTHEILLKVCA
jgi:hypothetical protein